MIEKVEFAPSYKHELHAPGRAELPHVRELKAKPAYIENFHVTLVFKRDIDDALYAKVKAFATEYALWTHRDEADLDSVMTMGGSVTSLMRAFETQIYSMQDDSGRTFRVRSGVLSVPKSLADDLIAVLGFDNRPIARTYRCRSSVPYAARTSSWTALQVAKEYDFPKGDGRGQTIAIIELGGGYTKAGLLTYFQKMLGNNGPTVIEIDVDGGDNAPTNNPDGPDGEVLLDIQVAGSVATKCNIVVYFASNTDQGFHDAITRAISDTKHNPSVISISWGGPEDGWTQQAINAMNSAFQLAATRGITVLAASGDNGSSDGEEGNHVDYPASDPYVLGCGGTKLTIEHTLLVEAVWNETSSGEGAGGGGYSASFPTPAYQENVMPHMLNRGVPDVAGNADPETGYEVFIDGQWTVIGGTSAVAPLYAGLIALVNQAKGHSVGFINPKLYANPSVCRDVVSGNNGGFAASTGWDAGSGLGVIDGTKLLAVL